MPGMCVGKESSRSYITEEEGGLKRRNCVHLRPMEVEESKLGETVESKNDKRDDSEEERNADEKENTNDEQSDSGVKDAEVKYWTTTRTRQIRRPARFRNTD